MRVQRRRPRHPRRYRLSHRHPLASLLRPAVLCCAPTSDRPDRPQQQAGLRMQEPELVELRLSALMHLVTQLVEILQIIPPRDLHLRGRELPVVHPPRRICCRRTSSPSTQSSSAGKTTTTPTIGPDRKPGWEKISAIIPIKRHTDHGGNDDLHLRARNRPRRHQRLQRRRSHDPAPTDHPRRPLTSPRLKPSCRHFLVVCLVINYDYLYDSELSDSLPALLCRRPACGSRVGGALASAPHREVVRARRC